MRVLLLLLLAGCSANLDPITADAGTGPDAAVQPAITTPVWSFTSPYGMAQTPRYDMATAGPLQYVINGWDQIAGAGTDSDAVGIMPMRGARGPRRLLEEQTGSRSLIWTLTPIGHVWNNPVVWDDGTVDPSGRVLYHVLEGGVLNATWTGTKTGDAFLVLWHAAPVGVAPGVFHLGPIRMRVVIGIPAPLDKTMVIAPVGGRVQVLVYSDPLYDTAAVDAVGALLAPAPGHVFEMTGAVAEKHVRFVSPAHDVDAVLATGTTPASIDGPTVLADRGEILVGGPDRTDTWRLSSLAVKIIKTGVIGMRRMRYVHPTEVDGVTVTGQTFNFYVNSPRGTVTLWPVGRIVAPYRLSLFEGPQRVMLADFSGTENDYSEDLSGGTNVMETRAAWAWDDTTLISAATLRTRDALSHTGQEGNSVDGGWRHVVTGRLSSFSVGDATSFTPTPPGRSGYRYDAGDAAQVVIGDVSVFHHARSWTGAWSERANKVASLALGDTLYYGAIKDLHAGEVLPDNSELQINDVVSIATGQPPAPAMLRARYALPANTPLRDGMLDLDLGARTHAPWDLATSAGVTQVTFGAAQ